MDYKELEFNHFNEEMERQLTKEGFDSDLKPIEVLVSGDFFNNKNLVKEDNINITISDSHEDWIVFDNNNMENLVISNPVIEYTDFDKHLAYILDKSKSELTDKVMEIGEGKFKADDIEARLEQIIKLVKGELSC